MERRSILLIVSCMVLFLVIGVVRTNQIEVNNELNADLLTPAEPEGYEPPLEYSSFKEFYAAVRPASVYTMSQSDSRFEKYNISDLNFFFKPQDFPQDASIYSIRVTDRYVALYYKLGALARADDVTPCGVDELTSTAMFEWTRLDEGKSLLKHQIDQFGLSELEETGVYYDSIKWFENPEEEIGRQYYWEHDRYLFSMYIPNSEVSGTLSFEVEQVLLDY